MSTKTRVRITEPFEIILEGRQSPERVSAKLRTKVEQAKVDGMSPADALIFVAKDVKSQKELRELYVLGLFSEFLEPPHLTLICSRMDISSSDFAFLCRKAGAMRKERRGGV